MTQVKFDLIIVGGGVAGLWLLNRTVQAGYNAILIEQGALGGEQSVRSQGIIHGGTKYALNGVLTQASSSIKEMPSRWQDCLKGEGEIDLRDVEQLSDAHYMWSKGTLGSKMTTFFATKAFRGRIDDVAPNDRPLVFQDKAFKGSLYRLNELVLNVPSLIEALSKPVLDRIFKANLADANIDDSNGNISSIVFPEHDLQLLPASVVITAGEGTESLCNDINLPLPAMQRRPLHMVMVKHNYHLPTFAHCIGTGSKPVATITTHPTKDGNSVWYIGGDIAETGVDRSQTEQIHFAKKTLKGLLPWVNLDDAQWQSFHVNRAEPKQSSLVRPDSAFAHQTANCIVAWPTKLALSPNLTDQVMPLLPAPSAASNLSLLNCFTKPDIASPVWDTMF